MLVFGNNNQNFSFYLKANEKFIINDRVSTIWLDRKTASIPIPGLPGRFSLDFKNNFWNNKAELFEIFR